MKKRINFNSVQPTAYNAMDALDQYVGTTTVSKQYQELIRIRASQINGCAYCVDAHTKDACDQGETLQRIALVSAWREAGNIFSDEEKVLFKMTEEITHISQQGLTEDTYEKAIASFGETQTAEIIMIIVTINAWNRIGVATQLRPARRNTKNA
ncbi:carboxymuconolactone decarboxylase family protein [Chitinophaga pendula]|uniref:carboxymuconolactone decarboxylase family protein n=1 Tax=Chitinophaga TaxID=79328 RepID=UPI000BB04B8A|nr:MULTISPECIES: carboxymuconolactone decarboxylase family protein [Chitinophaga]ASZ10752.1 hypothetical protein CK934_07040 [Chitinophaga sp. MD30]UCJ06273.1 carboxymuconolactone decarboxylase family protein [Chitinophaga pendula]